MALSVTTASSAPRAASRRAFRHGSRLPEQPAGVEVLAAVRLARERTGRAWCWDARLESSAIAVLAYLYRRGHGEKWAGRGGSGRYACSLAQLIAGLAPIMGWEGTKEQLVRRHRKSVQRWLDWLETTGLVSHTPQQDEEGYWWRTIIELHPAPVLATELLQEAAERRDGWWTREQRRVRRAVRLRGGRRRNLTAILRQAHLNRSQRRTRARDRRVAGRAYAERLAVRVKIRESLADAVRGHQTHPFGASTTSRTSLDSKSKDELPSRALTRAPALISATAPASIPPKTVTESNRDESPREPVRLPTGDRDAIAWQIAREVAATWRSRPPVDWQVQIAAVEHRISELADWPVGVPCSRSRLLEAWTLTVWGPLYAAVGGSARLALWREQNPKHGARLDRALARYESHAAVRPDGFPAAGAGGLLAFLRATPRPESEPKCLAYDVARFDQFTKQMCAYAQTADERWQAGRKRRARRRAAERALQALNARIKFRIKDAPNLELITAAQLADRQAAERDRLGRRAGLSPSDPGWRAIVQAQRLERRDQQLLEGRSAALDSGTHHAASAYAERWLP